MSKITDEEMVNMAASALVNLCHGAAIKAEWWTKERVANPFAFSNALMLIVSEIAEAMEGDRKSIMDDHLPHRPMREVELAYALIRIFDLAGAMAEKMAYNAQRQDHKPENRAKDGGKKY